MTFSRLVINIPDEETNIHNAKLTESANSSPSTLNSAKR